MTARYPLVLNGTTIQELQSGDTLVSSVLGFTPIDASTKGVANGVASLDGAGLVPSTQLPSYVDDVLEFANLAAFPVLGESGKIYVAVDTSKTYRWSGSVYIEISASPGTTDSLLEGTTNLYFTTARARASVSATQNLTYNSTTGVFTGPDLTSYLTSSAAAAAYQPLDADLTAFAAKTAPSGAVVGTTDTQTLTNKTVTGLKETRVAIPASNIDLSAGNYFTRTISGATTFTVSNVPSSGTAQSFIFDLTNGGSATITWFSGVKWAGGTAPTLTSAGRDVLGFFTHDGGTTWTGLVLGKDVK